MADLSTHKRRRRVSRASITCLTTKVRETEARKDDLGIAESVEKSKGKAGVIGFSLQEPPFCNHISTISDQDL